MSAFLHKITLSLLLLLTGASAAGAVCVPDSVPHERAVDYYYLQALSLIELEEYDAAYDMLEHCRALSPSSSAVLFQLSSVYQFLGQRDEALAILRKIVEDNPQNILFWNALVQFFENEGNSEALIQVYEEMIRKYPADTERYLTLSMYYYEQGRYEQAIKALDDYVKIEGNKESVAFQRYKIYLAMNNKEAAIAEVLALIADNPDEVRYLSLLGETYSMIGEHEKAFAVHSYAVARDSDNVYSLKCLAGYYKIQNNDSLYCNFAEKVIRHDKLPSEERLNILRDYILYRDQSGAVDYAVSFLSSLIDLPYAYEEAAQMLFSYYEYRKIEEKKMLPLIEKVLTKEPDNKMAHMTLLMFAIERNDYQEVVTRSEAAIMYFPEMLAIYYYRGLSLSAIGRREEAIATFMQGIERCSDVAMVEMLSDVYAVVGDLYHECGKTDEAMEAYESSLAYNSSNIVVLNNYAYYLALENRELEKALKMSARTLEEDPDEPMYIDTYAWILFRLGRYDEAKEYADKLLQDSQTKSAVEYHHCGDIYAKSGNIDRAVECWILARDNGDDSKVLKRKIKKRKYIPDGKKK